jgi:protein dithiol:quinone oxidoreductase
MNVMNSIENNSQSKFLGNTTLLAWGAWAFAFACMAAALGMQHLLDKQPCVLCIFQRYAYCLALVGITIYLATHYTTTPKWLRIEGIAVWLLGSVGGLIAAGWNLWVIYHPTMSCGVDPIETFVNALWPALWLPSVFESRGLCSDAIAPILGIPMAAWSFVGLFIIDTIGMLCLVQLFRKK